MYPTWLFLNLFFYTHTVYATAWFPVLKFRAENPRMLTAMHKMENARVAVDKTLLHSSKNNAEKNHTQK